MSSRVARPRSGCPPATCYALAAIACSIATWDFAHAFRQNAPHRPALERVGYANLGYAALSALTAVRNAGTLTPIGRGYFWTEIALVAGLGRWELSQTALKLDD